MPTQGTIEQNVARSLTNEALANRISMIQDNRRAFDKKQADAFLEESARRLQWRSAYLRNEPSPITEQELVDVICGPASLESPEAVAAAIIAKLTGAVLS